MKPTVAVVWDEAALVGWGERIGREAARPLVLALRGDLGAGKTTLARAVARGAGVVGPVPSPTFNLVFVYETPRGPLYHYDLYRVRTVEELIELGWGAWEPNALVLVEWPERAGDWLPAPRWEVTLEEVDENRRRVRWAPVGSPVPLPPGGEP